MEESVEHVDVVIVGAGLSGIGSAYHLQKDCPGKTFTLLEGRDALGGTWDQFRYPGIRSDSDMHTLGYRFKPWRQAKAIADGPSILSYVTEVANENGIADRIRFKHRVKSASWSSADARWTVEAERADEGDRVQFTCNMLLMCGGYYSYEKGHLPEFKGIDDFRGNLVQPQFWPEDLDYAGKRVVVIGSGATAMTLVPAMAEKAALVTMVQRSPTYVVSWPEQDALANKLRKYLPEKLAYAITRWKNVRNDLKFYQRTRTEPDKVKEELIGLVRAQLGPDFDVETHFTPRYNPWDQRLCLVPNGDLFDAINAGKAAVVTDHIDGFTEHGLKLASGVELPADIIVTATGLELVVLSGVELSVDGRPVNVPDTYSYKGMMYSGVPNLVQTFGYINASWTLRADLTAEYVCRLINRMDQLGMRQVTPQLGAKDKDMPARPWIDDFSAGYMQRMMHLFPKQGDRGSWRHTQNYAMDKKMIRDAPVDDDALHFTNPAPASRQAEPEPAVAASSR
jgi:monooxygenase